MFSYFFYLFTFCLTQSGSAGVRGARRSEFPLVEKLYNANTHRWRVFLQSLLYFLSFDLSAITGTDIDR